MDQTDWSYVKKLYSIKSGFLQKLYISKTLPKFQVLGTLLKMWVKNILYTQEASGKQLIK